MSNRLDHFLNITNQPKRGTSESERNINNEITKKSKNKDSSADEMMIEKFGTSWEQSVLQIMEKKNSNLSRLRESLNLEVIPSKRFRKQMEIRWKIQNWYAEFQKGISSKSEPKDNNHWIMDFITGGMNEIDKKLTEIWLHGE
jgi:hypothetical protein